MEVTLYAINKRTKKKIVNDYFWYDSYTKQRLHGKGGRMIFVYDHKAKRSVPRIIDAEEYVYENSYKTLIKWTKDHGLPVIEFVPGYYVVIDVNDNDWIDLEDDLYRHRIPFDSNKDNIS